MNFETILDTTIREVDESIRDYLPTHIVRIKHPFTTSSKYLWAAITEHKQLQKWLSEITGDINCDNHFSIQGNANCKVVICKPLRNFEITWVIDNNTSWVNVDIETIAEGAILTLQHELPTNETSEAHWKKYGPGAVGLGWELAIRCLDVYLATAGQPTIEPGAAWAESELGKKHLREWARAWGIAHENSGSSKQEATKMAELTAKFYTGTSS